MNEITIRKAVVEDERTLLEIRHKSWLSAYTHIFSKKEINKRFEERYNDYAYREKSKKRIENAEHFYIAEENGEPVAMMILDVCNGAGEAEIECLYCLPTHQRMGIGGKLFDLAKQIFKAEFKPKFVLTALKENHIGFAFYKKKGGVVVDEYADELCGKIVQKVVFEFDL